MSRFRALLLMLVFSLPVFSKEDEGALFLDPRISTDFQTVQTGLRLGDEELWGRFRISGFLDAEFSPLPNGTRVTVSEAKSYTIRDAWYSVGPGLGAAWLLGKSVYVAGSSGVSRTFGRGGVAGWAPWLDVGFRFPILDQSYWGIFYQYRPMPVEIDHRLALQFRFRAI